MSSSKGKEKRIAVRLNDNAKTIIFVKPGKDIESAKNAFINRPDSYHTFSAKAVQAREQKQEEEQNVSNTNAKIDNYDSEDWFGNGIFQ